MIQLEERLYTSTEVAEILGVSLRSVYRYLEEGKLDAEIKTATGRHRFSKKNIIDFLYPTGENAPKNISESTAPREVSTKTTVTHKEYNVATKTVDTPIEPIKEDIQAQEQIVEPASTSTQGTDESDEPVDWLAKFREAAKKFREETDAVEIPEPVAQAPKEPIMPKHEPESFSGFGGVTSEPVREDPATKSLYYRSSLGGLKEIAQNIDKTSRSAGVPYAFTMNAGLSLFKPIKPFSVLHAYVKPQDLPFFERVLGLTPSEETGAQLCLYVSSDTEVFANREEMHGLFVVSKKKLLEDITKTGDHVLIEETKSVL